MDFVEQVKSSVDIVKVIGEHVRLKKLGGSGRYVGLCPFHQEKTPSFSVHAGHQYYKCFGCGEGGDVFKFLQEMERVSFFEALKLLAERNGIPMPKRAEYTDPESKLRGSLLHMHEVAAQLYRQNLNGPAGADARAYLAKRGVTPALAEEFGLGVSADSWDQLTRRLQEEHCSAEQLEASGLVMKRQEGSGFYDRFRGRLMFPIHNESGKAIGFGGRALKPGDDPKYLNSPETSIYRKSFVLYNLHRAKDAMRKGEQVILVEGYMDAIGVYSAGVREVVASCGTALTNTQVRILKKHTDHIVVNFDPDTAGAKAAERSIQMLLEEGMRVRVVELEGGLDPDEYVKQNGADAYREKLKQSSGYFHWLADRARRKFDMNSAEGRIAGMQFLLPAIQKVHDKLERATIAEELASYLNIDRGLVLDQFRKIATERNAALAPRSAAAALPGAEKVLLNALLTSAEARPTVLPRIVEMRVFDRLGTKAILQTLAVLSSEDKPFSFSELEQRLDSPNRDLLASVVFADEIGDEFLALDQANQCLRTLEAQNREMQVSHLRDSIRASERAGNFSEAMRLMEQLNELSVKRKPSKIH
jgi:DNA primase